MHAMNRLSCPLGPVLLLALVGALATWVPGTPAAEEEAASSFSLVQFVKSTLDPLPLLVALGAAIAIGRMRGLRTGVGLLLGRGRARGQDAIAGHQAAWRTLSAAARGYLWTALVLNALCLVTFYWPAPPQESTGLFGQTRLDRVLYGGLLTFPLGVLWLLPWAERARALGGRKHSGRSRLAVGVDALAILGLFAMSWIVLLSVLPYRVSAHGADGLGRVWVAPSLSAVDGTFALWCLVAVAGLTALAYLPVVGVRGLVSGLGQGDGDSDLTTGPLGRTILGAGGLVAVLVATTGMNALAGMEASETALQQIAGRMLIPAAVAAALAATALILPTARKAQSRPG